MTVMSQIQRESVKTLFKGKKYKPLDLRFKKTRAIRRKLTNHQNNKITLKQLKKRINFPKKTCIITH